MPATARRKERLLWREREAPTAREKVREQGGAGRTGGEARGTLEGGLSTLRERVSVPRGAGAPHTASRFASCDGDGD